MDVLSKHPNAIFVVKVRTALRKQDVGAWKCIETQSLSTWIWMLLTMNMWVK